MPVDTVDTEIISRFQQTDALLGELRAQATALRQTVATLAGHDRSLAEIADHTGASAGDVARLADTAAQSKDALVGALDTARSTLELVTKQAATLDPQLVVNMVETHLRELERAVTDEFTGATAQFDEEVVRLGQLARRVEDSLQLFDPRRFLADLDDRIDGLDGQIERLTIAAVALDDLQAGERRKSAGEDLAARVRKIERRLSPAVVLPAYLTLLVLTLIKG